MSNKSKFLTIFRVEIKVQQHVRTVRDELVDLSLIE